MAEVIRCSECGMTFKGVPGWLGGVKVTFTCTNCPKKGGKNAARFEPVVPSPTMDDDTPVDLESDAIDDEMDEDMDLAEDEIDTLADDKEL